MYVYYSTYTSIYTFLQLKTIGLFERDDARLALYEEGVSDGKDAYRKIRAGASLVQMYTAFAYQGPAMLPKMKAELVQCLAEDGFDSIESAVGADHRRIGRR